MKATQLLRDLGQSIWLDNITRELLESGTLGSYIDELSVTGLTSNPTIFDHGIKNSSAYDSAIRDELAKGKSGEALFFDIALADITRAADLFRPIHDRYRRRLGVAGSLAPPRSRHGEHIAGGQRIDCECGAAKSVHQDPGDEGRPACYRGGDLCQYS